MSHRSSTRWRVVAPLVVGGLAVLTTACGGGESGSGPEGSTPTSVQGVQQDQVIKDDSKPKPGGNLRYGTEAETDGLNPVKNRWAISGTLVGLAVYDPLAAYNDKGEVRPYLAEKFESSADFKTWTMTMRPNVTFHDGSPLTAAAVKQLFEGHLASPLTKPVFSLVDTLEVTGDLTLVITMKEPWATFPVSLTSQAGMVAEPSTLDGDGSKAVGTGPFQQVSWEKNSSWKGKKYANYWRKDADGVQLPYLDTVEFRPVTEVATRSAAIVSGDLDMMHTNEAQTIVKFREQAKEGKVQIVEDRGESEEGMIIINNAKEPLSDVRLRRALAHASDREAYAEVINENVLEIADGPFAKSSPWYSETPNAPQYDLAKATQLVDEWKAENGGQAPTFELSIADSAETKQQAEFWKTQWEQAGFKVDIKTVDQAALIANAVQGKYQASIWRQFGSPDPDFDYIWWASENAGDGPEGGLTLNIARHKSDCVDKALKTGRSTKDVAVRKQAYADLANCFADTVPYIFYDRALWAIVATNDVRGITNGPLPDGEASMPIGAVGDFGGIARLTQTWLTSS